MIACTLTALQSSVRVSPLAKVTLHVLCAHRLMCIHQALLRHLAQTPLQSMPSTFPTQLLSPVLPLQYKHALTPVPVWTKPRKQTLSRPVPPSIISEHSLHIQGVCPGGGGVEGGRPANQHLLLLSRLRLFWLTIPCLLSLLLPLYPLPLPLRL
jgi:hypothetical protein